MGYKKTNTEKKRVGWLLTEAGGSRKKGNFHQRVHISNYRTNKFWRSNAQNGWVSLKIKREDHKLFSPHRQKKGNYVKWWIY